MNSPILNYRPELLRQWLADATSVEAARVQLDARQVRALAQDALAAHDFRTALVELVLCQQDPADAGRVQAAWKRAFEAVGRGAADLRWEFTGEAGLKRFLTQKQYDAQTPATQKWYRPICPKCGTAEVTASNGDQG